MRKSTKLNVATIGMLALATGGCATHGSWDAYDFGDTTPRSTSPSTAVICPVVLTNETGEQLDASLVAGGVTSLLGLLPAGRSLSFGVSCDAGSIQALGVARGHFLSDDQQYRVSAYVEPEGPTRVGLSIANLIR